MYIYEELLGVVPTADLAEEIAAVICSIELCIREGKVVSPKPAEIAECLREKLLVNAEQIRGSVGYETKLAKKLQAKPA